MVRVKDIQKAIQNLKDEDFIEFREWFSEKDWEKWEKQIEVNTRSRKLNLSLPKTNNPDQNR